MHDYLEIVETAYIAFCRRALPFAVEFFFEHFVMLMATFLYPKSISQVCYLAISDHVNVNE